MLDITRKLYHTRINYKKVLLKLFKLFDRGVCNLFVIESRKDKIFVYKMLFVMLLLSIPLQILSIAHVNWVWSHVPEVMK